MILTHL